jgi:hypothetical protein
MKKACPARHITMKIIEILTGKDGDVNAVKRHP